MTGSLLFMKHGTESHSVPLTDGQTLVIGRNPDADVPFTDLMALSRLHCRVRVEGGRVWIEPLKSRGRIFVNRKAIGEAHELKAGDLVTLLPELEFRFLVPMATEAFLVEDRVDG